jgi:hypothetical protein
VVREVAMSKGKESPGTSVEIVPIQTTKEIVISPPNSGVVGRFLEETQNMFRARAMRMTGLLRRINESGQRAESLLRMAAEKMEAAEAKLQADLGKEGLLPEPQSDME